MSVHIESPYAITDILSRTVSKLSQIISQILETVFLSPSPAVGEGGSYLQLCNSESVVEPEYRNFCSR